MKDKIIIKLKKKICHYSISIKEALQLIENNNEGFLVCVNDENKVLATLTDGDIRRALLNNYNLDDKIVDIYNMDFAFLSKDTSFRKMCTVFKSKKVDFIPIVDAENILINIITKKQFHLMLLEDIDFDIHFDFSTFDKETLEHEIYSRPWGFYKSTILSSHEQSKIIVIFPHSELSLQEHKRREEHWIIVKGKGRIILGESMLDAYPGQHVFIPKGCKHQIINTSDENLLFTEVQLGDYFGEDDIIRYSDKYGRKIKGK